MSKNTKLNTIRIIAGKWRGRRLPVLDYPGLRPTTDRVRETIFNWLMNDVSGAKCLDVYAGTGALGIECLSRGAAFVEFIESKQPVINSIQNSIDILSPESGQNVSLIRADANLTLQVASEEKFDIVFLDPPFNDDLIEISAALLEENQWLSDKAIIYIECDVNKNDLVLPINWLKYKSGRTGQSEYYLYRREK